MEALKSELEARGPISDSLLKVLNDFYRKMTKDTMLSFFFQGKDIEHIIEQQRKLLLMVLGIEKKYGGKPVGTAHADMPPILQGHFDRRLFLLSETLKENNFSAEAASQWVGFERQFEKVIVK